MQIPDDAILRIAQAMLPLMQQYFESEEGRLQLRRQTEALEQKEAAPASQPAPPLIFAHYLCVDIKIINPNPSPIRKKFGFINNGDPYGNRTRNKKRQTCCGSREVDFSLPFSLSFSTSVFLLASKKLLKSSARLAISFCARCVYFPHGAVVSPATDFHCDFFRYLKVISKGSEAVTQGLQLCL